MVFRHGLKFNFPTSISTELSKWSRFTSWLNQVWKSVATTASRHVLRSHIFSTLCTPEVERVGRR